MSKWFACVGALACEYEDPIQFIMLVKRAVSSMDCDIHICMGVGTLAGMGEVLMQ